MVGTATGVGFIVLGIVSFVVGGEPKSTMKPTPVSGTNHSLLRVIKSPPSLGRDRIVNVKRSPSALWATATVPRARQSGPCHR